MTAVPVHQLPGVTIPADKLSWERPTFPDDQRVLWQLGIGRV
jgi:hypothetical protein